MLNQHQLLKLDVCESASFLVTFLAPLSGYTSSRDHLRGCEAPGICTYKVFCVCLHVHMLTILWGVSDTDCFFFLLCAASRTTEYCTWIPLWHVLCLQIASGSLFTRCCLTRKVFAIYICFCRQSWTGYACSTEIFADIFRIPCCSGKIEVLAFSVLLFWWSFKKMHLAAINVKTLIFVQWFLLVPERCVALPWSAQWWCGLHCQASLSPSRGAGDVSHAVTELTGKTWIFFVFNHNFVHMLLPKEWAAGQLYLPPFI